MFGFEKASSDKNARVGNLRTPHGVAETPLFLPVATQATVKALTPADVAGTGCGMILANTYHLYLRPGAKTVAKLGGLHEFMKWNGPILTDSGGFQVFSLGFGIEHQVGKMAPLFVGEIVSGGLNPEAQGSTLAVRTKFCRIEEEGPTFQSHLDGTAHFFPPEVSVQTQMDLGADFVVALDECTSPMHDYEYTKLSMDRTHRWAKRSLGYFREHQTGKQAIFGVIQGGPFADLRRESAKFMDDLGFFGVGIGGALISRKTMGEILDWVNPSLGPQKPRHLLGIGTVPEVFEAVERGVDIFDCVHPTRIARMGHILYKIKRQKSKVKSAQENVEKTYNPQRFSFDITKVVFKEDNNPIDPGCDCEACRNYSRAYINHLFRARELLAYRLATIHNVRFMMRLMEEIRGAIQDKKFAKLKADWLEYS